MAYCTMCGAKLQDGDAFCTECGAPVAPAQETAFPAQPEPQSAPVNVSAPVYTASGDTSAPSASSGPAPSYTAAPAAQPYAPAASYSAPATPYAQPGAKKNRTAAIIVIAIFAAIALVVGLVTWLVSDALSGAGNGGGSLTPVVSADAQGTFENYLNAVAAGEPAAAWRCCYEFCDVSNGDLNDYVEEDRADYGYADGFEQTGNDFDLFVWWYSPDSIDLTSGVEQARLISFDAHGADGVADGDYVTCTATVRVSSGELRDYDTVLTFSMTPWDGGWYVVYYDDALAYSGGGASLDAEDAEYMFTNFLQTAPVSEDAVDVLYYINSTIDTDYDDKEALVESLCAQYGVDEDLFGLAVVTEFLRAHGLQTDAVAQSVTLIDFSLDAIPADYAEGSPVGAHAEVYVKFEEAPAQPLVFDLALVYANGYWTVDYTL